MNVKLLLACQVEDAGVRGQEIMRCTAIDLPVLVGPSASFGGPPLKIFC